MAKYYFIGFILLRSSNRNAFIVAFSGTSSMFTDAEIFCCDKGESAAFVTAIFSSLFPSEEYTANIRLASL